MKIALAVVALLALACIVDAKLLGERKTLPPNWRKTAPADSTDEVHFIVALRQRNLDVLEAKYWSAADPDSDEYQNWMTIKDITDLIGVTQEEADQVISWLKLNGVTSYRFHGDAIECVSTVESAAKMFHTEFFKYTHSISGEEIVRISGEFHVREFQGLIEMVLGLSDFPREFGSRHVPAPDAYEVVVPQTIQEMYGVPTSAASSNNNSSQCVIEFQEQSYSPSQLSTFAKEMDIEIDPLSADHIVGNNNPNAPQIEATLDIQYVAAVGLGITNWFWLEKNGNWLYGFALHMFSTPVVPYVNSISYGWNEEDQCEPGIGSGECQQLGVNSKQYVARVNTEFMKIGLRGVALFAASGDSGANGRTDPGCSQNHLNPPFPGASPFVTTVGATQVVNAQNNLKNPPSVCNGQFSCISAGTEQCVSFAQAHFASGGGFSDVGNQYDWQKDVVQAYLNSGVPLPPPGYYNATGRAFPDVAAFGSNVLIYVNGNEPVGGTSASSPIFAGVAALLNQASLGKTGKPLGPMNPVLYKMAKEDPSTFTDITVGDNKCTESGCARSCYGFKAAPGWDPVSGLGTPVYPKMLAYINNLLDAKLAKLEKNN